MTGTITHNPQHYFHHSDLQRIAAERALAPIRIRNNDDILDIGCGDGKISASLSLQTAGNVVGIDLDDSMVHFACKKYPKLIYPNLNFRKTWQQDLSDIDFDRKFDKIFAFNVLHLVSDPLSLLRLVKTLLAPCGEFIATMPSSLDNTLFTAFQAMMQKHKIQFNSAPPTSKQTPRTVENLKDLLKQCHFTEISVINCDSRYAFVDSDEFRLWNKGVSAIEFGEDEKAEKAFYQELIEMYTTIDPNAKGYDDSFLVNMSHLHIRASY